MGLLLNYFQTEPENIPLAQNERAAVLKPGAGQQVRAPRVLAALVSRSWHRTASLPVDTL